MGDPIKELYQALKSTNIFLDEEDLKAQLKASPKDVYGIVSSNKDVAGLFVDYDDFLSVTGLKKKDISTPSADGGEAGSFAGSFGELAGTIQRTNAEKVKDFIGRLEKPKMIKQGAPKVFDTPARITAEDIQTEVERPQPFNLIMMAKAEQGDKGAELTLLEKEKPLLEDFTLKEVTGQVTDTDLQNLKGTYYGQKYLQQLFQKYNVLPNRKPGEEMADLLFAINKENAKTGYDMQNQVFEGIDNDILEFYKDKQGILYPENPSVATFTKSPLKSEDIVVPDLSSQQSISDAISQLQKSVSVVGKDGAVKDKEKIEEVIKLLRGKLYWMQSSTGVDPEINEFDSQIEKAVTRFNIDREKYETVKTEDFAKDDELNAAHFKQGLSYLKYSNPELYKNTVRTLVQRQYVADRDMEEIMLLGQEIINNKAFRLGTFDENFVNKQTYLDYTSKDTKKSDIAVKIGERLKELGYKQGAKYNPDLIKGVGDELGLNPGLVQELAEDEQIKWGGAIPKSGLGAAYVRGVDNVLESLSNSLEKFFGESPADSYLKSRKLDTDFGQKIVYANNKNEVRTVNYLPSDRNNLLREIMEGTGKFVVQAAGAYVAGGPLGLIARAGGATTSAATNIRNFAGTYLSSFFQAYGPSYDDWLQKTGDERTAATAANFAGHFEGATELFLPDIVVADKISNVLRKSYGKDLVQVFKNAGTISQLRSGLKPIIKNTINAVSRGSSVLGKENAEELVNNLGNYVLETFLSPKTAAKKDLLKETVETVRATSIDMIVPAILGGVGGSSREFTRQSLDDAAVNYRQSKELLSKALANGDISDAAYEQALSTLTIHRSNLVTAPKTDAEGNKLSKAAQRRYAFEKTASWVLGQQAERQTDDVIRKPLEEKAKLAEKTREEIYNPDEKTKAQNNVELQIEAAEERMYNNISEIDQSDIDEKEKAALIAKEEAAHVEEVKRIAEELLPKADIITEQTKPEDSLQPKAENKLTIEEEINELENEKADIETAAAEDGLTQEDEDMIAEIDRRIDDLKRQKGETPVPADNVGEQSKKAIGLQDKIDNIERRRQEELKSFTEREKESVKKSTKGTPINKDNPNSFKVGQEYNDGMLVIVQDVQTADNFDANIAENEGEGYTIIDRVLEYGEMKDGKQSKAPILRTRVFNNKEDADTYLEQQKQKFDSQIGKSRQYDKINAKYDAELAELEKQAPTPTDKAVDDVGFENDRKIVFENSSIHGTDGGWQVKKEGTSYENAKDIRQEVAKRTNGELGKIVEFKTTDKDGLPIYHVAISVNDTKRGAGNGFVAYSFKEKDKTRLTDRDIYDILRQNLNAVFEQGLLDKNGMMSKTVSLKNINKPSQSQPQVSTVNSSAKTDNKTLLNILPDKRSSENTGKVMITTDQYGNYKTRYIPFSIIEAANKNDKRSGQTAKEINDRGGYGDNELDRLLPGWRDMLPVVNPNTGEADQGVIKVTQYKKGDGGVGVEVKLPKGAKEVFHYSENENLKELEDREGGTWFTDNSYGYQRRGGVKGKVSKVIEPDKLNLASEKDVWEAGNGDWAEGVKKIKEQGFDGIKQTADGDKNYLIFDLKNVKDKSEYKPTTTQETTPVSEAQNNIPNQNQQQNESKRQEKGQEELLGSDKQQAPDVVPGDNNSGGTAVSPAVSQYHQEWKPKSKRNKYKVTYDKNGKREVRIKGNGFKISKDHPSYGTILRNHAAQYNYNVGQTTEAIPDKPQFNDKNEADIWLVENSQNPAEIAYAYSNMERQPIDMSSKEAAIAREIGKVKRTSFNQFGDRNKVTFGMGKTYFNQQEGETLDNVAQRASRYGEGLDVTENDVVEFMLKFPYGVWPDSTVKSEAQRLAEDKFEQLTGIPLNPGNGSMTVANRAAAQYMPAEREQVMEAINVEDANDVSDEEILNTDALTGWKPVEGGSLFDNDKTENNDQAAQNPTAEAADGTNTGVEEGTGQRTGGAERGSSGASTGRDSGQEDGGEGQEAGYTIEDFQKEIKEIGPLDEFTEDDLRNMETPFMAATDNEAKLKAAQNVLAKAQRELNNAEDKIAKTQASQGGMFGQAAQGSMFAVNRDEAGEILGPLREAVKTARAEVDRLTAIVNDERRQADGQMSLFDAIQRQYPPATLEAFNKVQRAIESMFGGISGFKGVKVLTGEDFESAIAITGADTSFSFVGVYAMLGDARNSWGRAVEMRTNGESADAIFNETGWFYDDLDNKWKYELKREGFVYKPEISPNDFKQAYVKNLDEVINYPELFEAYPEFRNFKVYGAPYKDISGAGGNGRILVNTSDSKYEQRQTILHEIQHEIQRREGFARGANREDGVRKVDEISRQTAERIAGLQKLRDSAVQQEVAEIDALIEVEQDYLNYIESNKENLADYFYAMYAGEIEARNIEARTLPRNRRKNPLATRDEIIDGRINHVTVDFGSRFMAKPDGTVYGFLHNGTIYINGDHLNLNTPIHEAAHLFTRWAQANAPELYAAGQRLAGTSRAMLKIKADPFYQKQAQRMRDAGRSEADIEAMFRDEALAFNVGNRGQFIADNQKSAFREWLKKFWNKIKAFFGKGDTKLENMGAEQFSNMSFDSFSQAMAERILSGERLEGGVQNTDTSFMATSNSKGARLAQAVQRLLATGFTEAQVKQQLMSNGLNEDISDKIIAVSRKYTGNVGKTSSNNTGRIKVSPIKNGDVKKRRQILIDLRKGTGIRIMFTKPSMRGSAGTYSPSSTAVKIKYNGDLDTTAHEIGHAIDDAFNIWGNASPQVLAEIDSLAKYGSEPPAGHPDPDKYRQNEGLAEFVRALIVNPDQARNDFPLTTELYNSIVSDSWKIAINKFSDDLRTLEGATGRDQIMSNVDMEGDAPKGLWAKIFGATGDESGFRVTWFDRFSRQMLNPFRVFDKAFGYAQGLHGVDEVMERDNPIILSRLLLGFDGKFGDIIETGMIDGEFNLLKDADGNNKNIKWLISPFDNTDEGSLTRDMEDTVAFMIAERTIEYSVKLAEREIEQYHANGIAVDPSILYHPRLHKYQSANNDIINNIGGAVQKVVQKWNNELIDIGQKYQDRIDKINQALKGVTDAKTILFEDAKNKGKNDIALKIFGISEKELSDKVKSRMKAVEKAKYETAEKYKQKLFDTQIRYLGELAKQKIMFIEQLKAKDDKAINIKYQKIVSGINADNKLAFIKFKTDGLSGIGTQEQTDIDVANKTIDEFENGDLDRLKRIKDGARRYREFADDILKYAVSKGRMSQTQYDEVKARNLQYLAMERIIETDPGEAIDVFKRASHSMAAAKEIIRSIKGSRRTISNPYSSLLDSLYKTMRESDRNEILVAFRNMIVSPRSMNDGQPVAFAGIGEKVSSDTKGAVKIFINGETEYWKFTKDIEDAIKGLDADAYKLPFAIRALPLALRWTVTNFPVFAARNFVRDTQDRILKSNEGANPIQKISDLSGDSNDWSEAQRIGALNAGYYTRDKHHYYTLMKFAIEEMAKKKNIVIFDKDHLVHAWEKYQAFLYKSETSNRVAEYRAAFRKAKSEGRPDYDAMLYAGYKTRELIDFAMLGHTMRIINQLIPFSNAAVQGLRASAIKFKENPSAMSARILFYSVLPSIAMWFWNRYDGDDDEYEDLPSYQRDLFWNKKVGKNTWLSVPKPFELSLPSAATDRGLSYFIGGNKKAFDGYTGTVSRSLLPVDETALGGPFRGLVEILANKDFFRDKNIIPPADERLYLELRDTESASGLSSFLQKNAPFMGKSDPRFIDHFIKSQFSYFGNFVLKSSNIGDGGGKDKFSISDLGFFKQSPAYNSPTVQEFFDYARGYGLTRSKGYKAVKMAMEAYFDATDNVLKDSLAKEFIRTAEIVLDEWKKDKVGELIIKEKEREADRKLHPGFYNMFDNMVIKATGK